MQRWHGCAAGVASSCEAGHICACQLLRLACSCRYLQSPAPLSYLLLSQHALQYIDRDDCVIEIGKAPTRKHEHNCHIPPACLITDAMTALPMPSGVLGHQMVEPARIKMVARATKLILRGCTSALACMSAPPNQGVMAAQLKVLQQHSGSFLIVIQHSMSAHT